MKLKLKEATTSKLVKVFIQDSSSTTGAGLTGLVFNSASLTGYWIAEGDATATAITLATATAGTWTSGGFIEVDATNMPGLYEVGLPDVTVDGTSEGSTVVMLKGAANMAPVVLEIELDAIDYQDAVRAGLTALPNAAADAAGGLPISDAGGLDLDAKLAATNEVTTARMGALTDWIDGGRLDLLLDAIPTTAMRGTDSAYTGTPPTAAAIRTEIDSNSTELAQLIENTGYTLSILAGDISNAGTATETYVITIDSVAYTATYAGLDADGNRGTTVLSKV